VIEISIQNCWEFKKCGRETGGSKVPDLGVCPASTFVKADGFCGGKNGGRACAYIAGTFCAGTIQGTYKDKEKNCGQCEFYRLLKSENNEASVLAFHRYIDQVK